MAAPPAYTPLVARTNQNWQIHAGSYGRVAHTCLRGDEIFAHIFLAWMQVYPPSSPTAAYQAGLHVAHGIVKGDAIVGEFLRVMSKTRTPADSLIAISDAIAVLNDAPLPGHHLYTVFRFIQQMRMSGTQVQPMTFGTWSALKDIILRADHLLALIQIFDHCIIRKATPDNLASTLMGGDQVVVLMQSCNFGCNLPDHSNPCPAGAWCALRAAYFQGPQVVTAFHKFENLAKEELLAARKPTRVQPSLGADHGAIPWSSHAVIRVAEHRLKPTQLHLLTNFAAITSPKELLAAVTSYFEILVTCLVYGGALEAAVELSDGAQAYVGSLVEVAQHGWEAMERYHHAMHAARLPEMKQGDYSGWGCAAQNMA